MNLKKQLAAILATIAAKRKSMEAVMTKAAEANRTANDDEENEIQAIENDIAKLEKNANRLRALIKAAEEAEVAVTPVAGETPEQAEATAEGAAEPEKAAEKRVHVQPNLAIGVGMAMLVRASAVAAKSGGGTTVNEVLKSWNAPENIVKAAQQKAVIGTTTDANFASGLVDYAIVSNEFIELVRKQTVVDKLAAQMRQVPFNVKIPQQTAAGTVGWVGEAQMKPVGNPQFSNVTMTFAKIAGIVLLSDELIRFSNPKADMLVRDDLVATTAQFIDAQFFDPTKAEAAESPASVLNGVTPITSTGTTADKIEADMNTLIAQMVDAGISLEGAYWVMGETRAMTISGLRDPLGRPFFDGMTLTGQRTLKGLPVLTSGAAADKIVLIVPSQILLADDGQIDFSVSNEATINMGTTEAPNLVNLFQNNLTAIRGERYIRWKKRHVAAAGYIKY